MDENPKSPEPCKPAAMADADPDSAAMAGSESSRPLSPPGPEPAIPVFDPTARRCVALHLDYDRRVNFAMQQNDVPIVKRLSVENLSTEELTDVIVGVYIDCGLAPVWQREIARISPGATYNLDHVDLALDASVLVHQTERAVAHLHAEVTCGTRIIEQVKLPIEVLAYNEWGGVGSLPEMLAAFVMPNHPAIDSILSAARRHLEGRGGQPSFSGYQSRSIDHVRLMIAAIYQAIVEADVGYIAPPASYETQGQKVRSPDQLLEHRLGTCLDLALLLAACAEAAGLNPLIILTQGHAFCGAWTSDESFSEPTIDDASRIRKRVQLGEIIAIEATAITTRPPLSLADAERAALRHLLEERPFHCAVDIRCARKMRIRPLPLRVAAGTFDVAENQPTIPTRGGSGDGPANGEPRGIHQQAPAIRPGAANTAADEEMEETPNARLDRWKRKLLDLSGRNRLINYRESNKSIALACPDLAALEDALAGGLTFSLHHRPKLMEDAGPRSSAAAEQRTGENVLDQFLRDELASRRLYSPLAQDVLERRLLDIYRAARSSIEESGANTLYLAVGFLQWYESSASSAPRRLAPILLLPLSLERRSVREGFNISLGDDEPRINVTLLEKLRAEFGVNTSGLDETIEDDHGLDIPQILQRFRRAVRDIPRWDIVEEAHLGLFSFTKFLMWLDLQERSGVLMRNPVVKYLVERPAESFDGDATMPEAAMLDQTRHPRETFCPLDADSSQLAAVFAAQDGRSFVLEGPPGTGKSQTITNLIAQCLTHGKRVLFVAEKMAALHVVHKRLAKIGLGPFCLELHSSKSSKREVLDQLQQALDVPREALPVEWESHSNELASSRKELNDFVGILHGPRDIGRSVYQATSRLIGLREVPSVPLKAGWVNSLDAAKIGAIHEVIDQLVTAGRVVGAVAAHPYGAIEREQWQMTLPEMVGQTVDVYLRSLGSYAEAADGALRGLQLAEGTAANALSRGGLRWLRELVEMLIDSPRPTEVLLNEPLWPEFRRTLDAMITRGRRRDDLRKELLARYRESLLSQNLEDLIVRVRAAMSGFFLTAWFKRRAVRSLIQPHARGPLPDAAALLADLELAIRLRDEDAAVRDVNNPAARALGPLWNGGEGDWSRLDSLLAWTERFRALLLKAGARDFGSAAPLRSRCVTLATIERDLCSDGAPLGETLRALLAAEAAHQDKHKALVNLLVVHEATAWGDEAASGAIPKLRETTTVWKQQTRLLPDWCHWRRARRVAVEAGIEQLVDGYERRAWPGEALGDVFDRSLCQLWLAGVTDSTESLRNFNSKEHERRIARFARLDGEQLELIIRYLRSKFAGNVPKVHGEASGASEMGILQRQLKLQRRHMPVRKLLQKLPNLLPRLKPCLLMSPLSVAQYLDPGHPPFDVVVFDEASQIPVWDAVGAIARGTQVIVVGDSKQLPPTSFFQKVDDEEALPDEDEFEEMESILDECSASGLRSLRLLWHYRSRHESLITFSNYHYYDNRLQTFPSPAERGSTRGVSLRYLEGGVYDRGDTRTNPAEAQAIVAEIVARLTSGAAEAKKSIGVVTFSIPQQGLIEDLLDAARRKHPEIEPCFAASAGEPVFVKNLENVQGDERDVILFSICYGPDSTGKVAMAFGPLNRQGGERRLNVAVTRAREQVIVFSTLRGDQIDLSRTSSVAVRHLKTFLDYAERGPGAIAEAVAVVGDAGADDSFEQDVRAKLRERGWQVELHVGCSGFRVDLAVRDLDRADEFALGVLCDGPFYAKADTARDRDRNRQAVLVQLGWRLHRVWSSDWWLDPQRELDRIEAAIREAHAARKLGSAALQGAAPSEAGDLKVAAGPAAAQETALDVGSEAGLAATAVVDAEVEEVEIDQTPGMHGYRTTAVKVYGDTEAFYEPKSRRQIRDVLLRVVKRESPIVVELAMKRVVSCWGFARVTGRAQSLVEELMATLSDEERPRLVDGLLWGPSQNPAEYLGFRVPREDDESPRRPDEVPAIEYANAAMMVLEQQVGLPKDALVREVAKLFGFTRIGGKVQASVESGIAMLSGRGGCVEKDGVVVGKHGLPREASERGQPANG
jgi:very-short-patch-repair endonuclease